MNEVASIAFGRNTCGSLIDINRREWLATNGLGGYAMGTPSGAPTRRYHGLLVAALRPPLSRTVLLAKLDETVTYDGATYPLFTNHWASGMIEPYGYHHIESFSLEGVTPVWRFACADALLEKRIWMQHGANTTYISYRLLRGVLPLALSFKALVTYREHHENTRPETLDMQVEWVEHGLAITAAAGARPFALRCQGAQATAAGEWYTDYYLSQEAYRGLDPLESYYHCATFTASLQPGESLTLVASSEAEAGLDGAAAYAEHVARQERIIGQAAAPWMDSPRLRQLLLAADQFIVKRPMLAPAPKGSPGEQEGLSVIAGYPWFGDWGRDTMISLPGLTLVTGRHEVAARILRTYARFVLQGMLPNRFPDAGTEPEYNTVDATLWYFEAIRAYHAATGNAALVADLFPVLEDIVDWHRRGARYHIRVDPADGLLYAGEAGVQLTWMDVKIGEWVVTPRTGKAVEVNALWYNALCVMVDFARLLGEDRSPTGARSHVYQDWAEQARASFTRFWNPNTGCCYDVIDSPEGPDPTLRPNQLLAVSLPHSPLPADQQRGIVDVCARHLLTSHGLRSLASSHPDYAGKYGGDLVGRDSAYHQGTVWGWLIGPFASAHLRVYQDPALTRTFLEPFLRHLSEHGLGSISEIFDGDAPFTPRGCIAQAWSVAEVLRAWHEIRSSTSARS